MLGEVTRMVQFMTKTLCREEPTAFTPSACTLDLPTQNVGKFAPQYQKRIFFLAFLLAVGTPRLSGGFRLVDQA